MRHRFAVGRTLALLLAISMATGLTGCQFLPAATGDASGTLSVVTVPKDAKTLAEALSLVQPGGMILLSPAVYREQLVIDKKDVTIRGLDRNRTIIDGEGKRPYGIVGIADGVRIQNLTVQNTTFYGVLVTGLHDANGPTAHNGDGYSKLDPTRFPPLQRFSIDYVTASNNGLYGIYAFDAEHGSITNSYASGSADSGYYVGQCADCDILVSGNVAERNAVGFENANASKSVAIVGNRFSNNRVGMTLISNYQEAFTPQSENLVTGNVLSDNISADSPAQADGGFGIGLGISGGTNNSITNNRIEGNPRAGVLLANTEDLPALGNTFTSNAFGGNGVDVANVSAARAPASANCLSFDNGPAPPVPTTLPSAFFADCSAGVSQPAIPSVELPSVVAPSGISFLKVPVPPDQPNLPDADKAPDALPASVDRPTSGSVALPPADLLIERTLRP